MKDPQKDKKQILDTMIIPMEIEIIEEIIDEIEKKDIEIDMIKDIKIEEIVVEEEIKMV